MTTHKTACDYCGKPNLTNDYACQECQDYHEADPSGPTLYRADGSEIKKDSAEYNHVLEQVAQQAEAAAIKDRPRSAWCGGRHRKAPR